MFIFESVYTVVVAYLLSQQGTSYVSLINGNLAFWTALVVSAIFVFASTRWLKKQWHESAIDKLPPSESTQLRVVMTRLNSKLDKLDKLDKIDKLVKALERQEAQRGK